MHPTFRLMVTNYNSWAWSYWKGNLSQRNRQQIPNYLGNTINLLSLDLKNCDFIAIFLKFIDFVCSFVQWHNVCRLHTQTGGITNTFAICQLKAINGSWSQLMCAEQQGTDFLQSKHHSFRKVKDISKEKQERKRKYEIIRVKASCIFPMVTLF